MNPNRKWRWILIGSVLLVAVWLIYPTVRWALLPEEHRELLEEGQPPKWKGQVIKLGLDLRGGIDVLLEVNTRSLETFRDKEAAVKQVLK